jgi:hypothetical protein
MVVVPNQILGKGPITNFSRPTDEHGVEVVIGFSNDDPPNKVKRVLLQCAQATPGILARGISIRTHAYAESSISYLSRFFLTDYERMPEIIEDLQTRIWYAMRREGLTTPYPTRTIYKTEVPYERRITTDQEIAQVLSQNPLFSTLADRELEHLVSEAALLCFARGERIITQGENQTTLYLLKKGRVQVYRIDASNRRHELATLKEGDFFGEMSLLTGEVRSANVDASEDSELVVIYKESLQTLLESRSALAESIAQIMHERMQALAAAKNADGELVSSGAKPTPDRDGILKAIRGFFGLRHS